MVAVFLCAIALAPPVSLTVRVDGEGYLRFVREGRIVYARAARLVVANGSLVHEQGLPLCPSVRVPVTATGLEVNLQGEVFGVSPGRTRITRLVLARFEGPVVQEGPFATSARRASLGSPGEDTFGVIRTDRNGSPAQRSPSGGVIAIRPLSEVDGGTVKLGDVAELDPGANGLAGIDLGPAPAVGIDQIVTESRVRAALKRAGVEAEVTVPKGAVIRRKGQTISHDLFVEAAVKAAQGQIGEIPFTCTDRDVEFKAPAGRFELKAESVTFSGSVASVTVAAVVEGVRVNSRTLSLKPEGAAQIRAGAAVKLVMKSAGVTVELPGKTRTAGWVGQTITVVTDSGSVLTGTVIGPDRVEVKL